LKNVLAPALIAFLIGAAPAAHAIDIKVTSDDPVVDKNKFGTVVTQNIPSDLMALGPNFRLSAVLETSDFKDKFRFYFYSVMLMRKVVEQGTGKQYWAATGGIRSHGATEGGDKLIKRIHDDMVAGAKSFHTDQ